MIDDVSARLAFQVRLAEIDRLLEVLAGLLAGFVIAFLLYALLLIRGGWPGATIRTLVGVVGGLALIVLGLLTILVAVALLATALYLAVVVVVLACLGIAARLLWRHLRRPSPDAAEP